MRHRRQKSRLYAERIELINEAIEKNDVTELRQLAMSGPGLVNNGLRQKAWPVLLGYSKTNTIVDPKKPPSPHRDARQLQLDVERTSWYRKKGLQPSEVERRRSELSQVALYALEDDQELHYYQGFHDICSLLTHVLGLKSAKQAVKVLAHKQLRMFLSDSLHPVMQQLNTLYDIIEFRNPELAQFLIKSETPPYFALSWLLTWFSHDLTDPSQAARLFDLFICSDQRMPLYVSACVVLAQHEKLLACPCDFSEIHHILVHLDPKLITDQLLEDAVELYEQHTSHIKSLTVKKHHIWQSKYSYFILALGAGALVAALASFYLRQLV